MNEQFHFESGQVCLNKGNIEGAIIHFEKLLETAKGQIRMAGYFLLAEAYNIKLNFSTAIACYEEVIRMPAENIDPNVTAKLKGNAEQNIKILTEKNKVPYKISDHLIFHPTQLIIEPINVCNYSCYKCLYPEMKRKKTELDTHKYENFLFSWVKQCGFFEEIIFTGGGEALLHKKLKDIVLITKKYMPTSKLTVGSNLALLTDNMAKELIDAGLNNWEVSLDCDNRSDYLKLTKKDTFDIVIQNIKILWEALDEGRKGTLEVAAHRAFDNEFQNKITAIEKLISGHYTTFRHAPYLTLVRRNFYPGLELWEQTLNFNANPNICIEPWTELVVTADGSIRRCCSDMFDCPDEETLGNIFTEDLEAILTNKKRWEIQNKLVRKDIQNLYLCGNPCSSVFTHTGANFIRDRGN
ncbi:MAG: radical SAM protein [Smithellaceae bacterium]